MTSAFALGVIVPIDPTRKQSAVDDIAYTLFQKRDDSFAIEQ
jgi:hypothetical protein